ncbi:MAG: aminotransferase class V-fold PLP-dependent enzyme, partial [Myxococcales bacterium]|nr:aminotransferase class V-fold PLP-dependent enzyme [Myxococcales bacterium]
MSHDARAYLDNNATTRLAPEVLEAMLPYLRDQYANPSSQHLFGSETRKRVDAAREALAAAVGARASEIVFTSGGTESDNFALRSVLAARPRRPKIVTVATEHPAVLDTAGDLARHGAEVVVVGVDRHGSVDLDALAEAVDDRTALVSCMWANNETGVIAPLAAVAEIAKAAGAFMHVDAVQAIGKVPVDVRALPIDL